LVKRIAKSKISGPCIGSLDGIFIDHLAVPGDTSVTLRGVPGSVQISVPVDVFLVSQAEAIANANGTPPGANQSAGRMTITFDLQSAGNDASLTFFAVDLGSLGPKLTDNQRTTLISTVTKIVGPPIPLKLSDILKSLNLPQTGAGTSVAMGGDFVSISLSGPLPVLVRRLTTDTQWGMFISSDLVEQIAKAQILSGGSQGFTSPPAISVLWSPIGLAAHVLVTLEGPADVPDPFTANVRIIATVDFSVSPLVEGGPTPSPLIREDVHWDYRVLSAGILTSGPFTGLEQELLTDLAHIFDLGPGGDVIPPGAERGPGLREYTMDLPVKPVLISGGSMAMDHVIGLAEGMLVGGAVHQPKDVGTPVVVLDVSPFSQLFFYETCSEQRDHPNEVPKAVPDVVVSNASLTVSGAQTLCSLTLLDDVNGAVAPLFQQPAMGPLNSPALATFHVSAAQIPNLVAQHPGPVRVLVQTSGGVRVADLGTPPIPQIDPETNVVTNAQAITINDCVFGFQQLPFFVPQWLADPGPDWVVNPATAVVLQVIEVQVSGLEENAAVTFDAALEGMNGTLSSLTPAAFSVPMLMPLRSSDSGARLSISNPASKSPAIAFRQSFLQRASSVALPGGRIITAGQIARGSAFAVTGIDFVAVVDASDLSAPRIVQRTKVPGVRGAFAIAKGILAWGDRGIHTIKHDEDETPFSLDDLFHSHSKAVRAAALLDNGKLAAIKDDDVLLFDPATGDSTELEAQHPLSIAALANAEFVVVSTDAIARYSASGPRLALLESLNLNGGFVATNLPLPERASGLISVLTSESGIALFSATSAGLQPVGKLQAQPPASGLVWLNASTAGFWDIHAESLVLYGARATGGALDAVRVHTVSGD
jgi:hypothetical protein